jgi:hypothetical protein
VGRTLLPDVARAGAPAVFVMSANSPADTYPFPGSDDAPGTILSISFIDCDTTCNTYAYGNRSGQVRLTRDGGNNWIDLDPGKTLPTRHVNWLAFDPSNPNAAISSFHDGIPGNPGHVFKSTNVMYGSFVTALHWVPPISWKKGRIGTHSMCLLYAHAIKSPMLQSRQ